MNLEGFTAYDAYDPLEKWDGKLQSEVTSYHMDKPMGLQAFLELPVHAQAEYLKALRKEHGARVRDISDMLGCTREEAVSLLRDFRLPYMDKGKKSASAEQAWAKFTEGYVFPPRPERVAEAEQHTSSGAAAPPSPRGEGKGGQVARAAEDGPSKAPPSPPGEGKGEEILRCAQDDTGEGPEDPAPTGGQVACAAEDAPSKAPPPTEVEKTKRAAPLVNDRVKMAVLKEIVKDYYLTSDANVDYTQGVFDAMASVILMEEESS